MNFTAMICSTCVSGLSLSTLLALASSSFAAELAKNAPAKVEKPIKETELSTITLTPEAEKRLGVETAPVERRKVERTRTFGGELIIPSQASTNSSVASEQTIFAILPALSPTELVRIAEAQIDADSQIDRARVQLDAAKVVHGRVEKLLSDKAGSVRSVDEAKVQVTLAESGLRAAKTRRDLLGAPVLQFMNLKRFWVRVAVYVGDLPRLNTLAEAQVGNLADVAGTNALPAKPVSASASANAAAATVDLFYEIANHDSALRFGQKVGVRIPLRDAEENLVVPWSAVLHDINGGTWVYENPVPHTFVRRRVQVRHVAGKVAVLESGPKPGAKVVVTAAAELFGTEFGVGK